MVAEDTASAVKLLQKMLYNFSVPPYVYIEVKDLADLFWKLVECDGGCYLSKYQKIPRSIHGFCMLHKQLNTGSSPIPSSMRDFVFEEIKTLLSLLAVSIFCS